MAMCEQLYYNYNYFLFFIQSRICNQLFNCIIILSCCTNSTQFPIFFFFLSSSLMRFVVLWFVLLVLTPSCLFSDASLPAAPLSENAKGFLATLEHSSEEELTLRLQDRMQFSKEAIACLVCVFDRLHSRIDNMCKQVQAAGN